MRKHTSSGKEKKLSNTNKTADLVDCSSQAPDIKRKLKRKVPNQIDKSAGHKTKQNRKELEIMDQNVDSLDLISQLPEHIIHHILSFLHCTKDAARTSILSKKWRDIWASFLVLDFDQRKFERVQQENEFLSCSKGNAQPIRECKRIETTEMFRNFVNNTLQRRIEQKYSIQKLVLHMTSYNFELACHMNQWISFAIESNIQELDLHVPARKHRCYRLPQTVFTTETITALRIFGCKLGTCDDVKLSKLQKLCLGQLHVDEQMIQNLILRCPLLEDLRLIHCKGLKKLLVSSDKLTRVDLHLCEELREVQLQAPSLQKFWYHGKKSVPCKINLDACKSLKSLTLEDANMTDDLFQKQLSNFPVLEKLILSKCNALISITISSNLLKALVFRECKQLKEVDINTPDLLSFEYKGLIYIDDAFEHRVPGMAFSSLNPSGLKEAKFYLEPQLSLNHCGIGFCIGQDDISWFAELKKLLRKFDNSKGLKLVVRSKKNVIIHEDLREILIPHLYYLKLEIIKSTTCLEDLLDNLLRTCHPETLSIVSSASSNFPEQTYEKMLVRGEPSCCKYNTSNNKCWRHFLKNARLVKFGDTEETSDWITWLTASASLVNQVTCFRLDWEHQKHGRKAETDLS